MTETSLLSQVSLKVIKQFKIIPGERGREKRDRQIDKQKAFYKL